VPSRRYGSPDDQPSLALDLEAATPAPPRARRARSPRSGGEAVQLSLDIALEDADRAGSAGSESATERSELFLPGVDQLAAPSAPDEPAEELPELEPEPPEFDPDPFADIPGFVPAVPVAQEFVLLPGSLRSRLDMREFTRFLASLPSVARDWEGAPEMDDGGIRLRGPEGGAWIYPEASRVRLVTDGDLSRPVAEDLVALCRWLESRAGMRLYPAGEAAGTGADRSLDPWDTFLGR